MMVTWVMAMVEGFGEEQEERANSADRTRKEKNVL
jgi:hypothetical protein